MFMDNSEGHQSLVMSMSNYLYDGRVGLDTMAASNQSVGLDHLTVIPENFEPESLADAEEENSEESS